MGGLETLLSWQFLLFALGCAALTFVVRKVFEFYLRQIVASKLWRELILPVLPILIGVLFGAMAKEYPYPGIASLSGRLFFGAAAGMLSTILYRVIRGLLRQRAPMANLTDDDGDK